MNHVHRHVWCKVEAAFPKNDVVDDDFFSASVFKSLHSREPKMNVMECIAYRSHCYLYGPIHASFAARRCRRTFLAEWRLSLHRWTYESECRCIWYVKYPKLNNGVSIRCIMFADICDVKSRQPFRKTTSSTMTFFGIRFQVLALSWTKNECDGINHVLFTLILIRTNSCIVWRKAQAEDVFCGAATFTP